jgi:hypothetical protein
VASHGTLRDLLVTPGAFFEQRSPRVGVAGRVVLLVAVAHAVVLLGGFLLLAVELAVLSETVRLGEAVDAVVARALGASLRLSALVVVNWLVVGLVLHVLAKLRHAGGTVGDTLYVVGWSAPVALLQPLAIVAGLLVGLAGAGSPEVFLRQATGIRTAISGLGLVATLVVLVWQAYIWVPGLLETHEMDHGAILPAAVTVLLGAGATLLA